MYEYYKPRNNLAFRLVKLRGDPFPSEFDEGDWELVGLKNTVPDETAKQIDDQCYALIRYDFSLNRVSEH
jgi:hypothetical protein